MRIARWVRYTFSLVIVACLVAALFHATIQAEPVKPPAPKPAEDVLNHVGVIDLNRMVANHPDAQKLVQIDQEIALLNMQIQQSGPSQEEIYKEIRDKMEKRSKELGEAFKAEVERVKQSLDARKAAVEGAMKAEADSIRATLQAYQAELQRKAGNGPITVAPDAKVRVEIEREMANAIEPILLAAKSKIARRQVEIQQEVDAKMGDAKRRMEQRVADQMEGVLRADQSRKLQLQLDIQTATDEDQRKKLQAELQGLNNGEEDKRAELRKQLSADFEAERKQQMAGKQAQFNAYRSQVEREASAEAQRRKMAVIARHGGVGTTPVVVNDLKKALEEKQRQLTARFESRKAELVGGLRIASEQAQQLLKRRQEEIKKTLKDEQQRIINEVVKQRGQISKEEQKRRDRLKAQLEELKAQRDRQYDAIVAQIRDNVSKLAEEKNLPLVVGDYRVNLKCQDLTDLALKQAAGAAGNNPVATPSGQ